VPTQLRGARSESAGGAILAKVAGCHGDERRGTMLSEWSSIVRGAAGAVQTSRGYARRENTRCSHWFTPLESIPALCGPIPTIRLHDRLAQ